MGVDVVRDAVFDAKCGVGALTIFEFDERVERCGFSFFKTLGYERLS